MLRCALAVALATAAPIVKQRLHRAPGTRARRRLEAMVLGSYPARLHLTAESDAERAVRRAYAAPDPPGATTYCRPVAWAAGAAAYLGIATSFASVLSASAAGPQYGSAMLDPRSELWYAQQVQETDLQRAEIEALRAQLEEQKQKVEEVKSSTLEKLDKDMRLKRMAEALKGQKRSRHFDEWRNEHIVAWLLELDLDEHVPAIMASRVDGLLLLNMDEDDFRELGIVQRVAARLLWTPAELFSSQAPAPAQDRRAAPEVQDPLRAQGKRRRRDRPGRGGHRGHRAGAPSVCQRGAGRASGGAR